MPTLQITRLTPKQTTLMGELLVYFHGRRLHALRKVKRRPEWVEPIPLTKIYELHKCNANDRKAVKVAAAVFFKQVARGNNITKKCSGWVPLEEPHINNQVKTMLKELYEHNIDHQQSVRTFFNTPAEKQHTVEVTTTFTFKSQEQAAAFAELMQAVQIEDDVKPILHLHFIP